jgi:hypothetical protein
MTMSLCITVPAQLSQRAPLLAATSPRRQKPQNNFPVIGESQALRWPLPGLRIT